MSKPMVNLYGEPVPKSKRVKRKLAPWTKFKPGHLPNLRRYPGLRNVTRTWMNNQYIVMESEHTLCLGGFVGLGDVTHVLIRRTDGRAVHSWQDLQRIKNEIFGPERLAIEVYPPHSELVDEAHMYHLWVFEEGVALPFGLKPSTTPTTGS